MVEKKALAAKGEDATNEWLSEAIISFLKGPCYSVPLMSFIDEHCLVFDLEEENKFEYTTLHVEFMDLVDKLLCELLEDLGVQPEKLVAVLSSDMSQSQISSFVLTSILSVEDFLQFKAMMVKRNVELTNQVIESLIEKKEQEAAKAAEEKEQEAAKAAEEKERKDREETEQILAENGEVDEETLLVLKLSKQQFELEDSARKAQENVDFSDVNGSDDQEDAFEKALKESLQIKSKIDQEKAELEQALAMSVAIEKEVALAREAEKAAAEEEEKEAEQQKEEDTASEPEPAPETSGPTEVPGAGSRPEAIKEAAPEQASSEVVVQNMAPVKKASSLPPLVLDNTSGSGPSTATSTPASVLSDYSRLPNSARFQGAGYKSDAGPSSAKSTSSSSVREAAYAAAETQKGLLQTKKENLLIKEKEAESTSTKVSDLDEKKKDYIMKQRAALVAKNNADRQKQLADFLLSSKENLFPKAREMKETKKEAELPPIGQSQSQDEKRAALRHELAKMFKQQLLEGM